MSRHFDSWFYTEDFDQEMLDYCQKVYGLSTRQRSTKDEFLRYGSGNNYFWTCNDDWHNSDFEKLTKQQFKEKIGMTTKQFTKADLVAGKHVVECVNKNKYLVTIREDGTLFGLNLNRDSYLPLDGHDNNLEYRSKDLSISAVYEMSSFNAFLDLNRNLKLVWKREEKTETQIQFEKLQQQIAELQDRANKLQATL